MADERVPTPGETGPDSARSAGATVSRPLEADVRDCLPGDAGAAAAGPGGAPPGTLQAWVIEHDRSWLFTLGYVGLAVVLSVAISLFWLVVVVGVHGALEWMRQSHLAADRRQVVPRVLWEVKLDLALILFALALVAWMDVILGLAGLGGATRLGLQSAARTAGWSRALQTMLLSVDDAAQLARMAAGRSGDDPAAAAAAPPWRRWTIGDRVAALLAAASLLAIVVAPLATDFTWGTMLAAMLSELHPFPPAGPPGLPAE